jgi:hypothetical protein
VRAAAGAIVHERRRLLRWPWSALKANRWICPLRALL